MRARYVIPLTRRVRFPDHWDIPFQGGICRIQEEDGCATALEVVFSEQPLDLAPRFKKEESADVETLVNNDLNLNFIRVQLSDAIAFLSCYFDVGLDWENAEAFYEAESESEAGQIEVASFKSTPHIPDLAIPFDMFARAVLCAQGGRGPKFEATLVNTARDALTEQRYIDSFRYSFLLIEAIYGEGQFKKSGLKDVLKGNDRFRQIVEKSINGLRGFERLPPDKVSELITLPGGVDGLIESIVEQRGLYFHGNILRKDSWRPEDQRQAHVLAVFCLLLAQEISQEAARSMWSEEVRVKFRNAVEKVGANIVYQVKFSFRNPGESFVREHQVSIRMPGTKPNPITAIEVTKHFLKYFEENAPMASLEKAFCTDEATGGEVFSLKYSIPR